MVCSGRTTPGGTTQVPRPQRELDPGGGPLVEFARELRALRARAGDPKFAAMSRRTGRSKTALADAASGRHLARWETVEDFVRACEADPRPWRSRWEEVRSTLTTLTTPLPAPEPPESSQAPERADPAPDTEDPGTGDADGTDPPEVDVPAPREGGDRRGTRRRAFVLGAGLGLLVGLVVGVAGVVAVGSSAATPAPFAAESLQAITVQNKVALGPSSLVEDRTPAYLSSLPIAYCATPSRSCKVPGTEIPSGVALVANCRTEGQQMANFNRAEAASRDNPDRADSSLWYRVSFPDGRSGYLSEVYVIDDDRGGMDLPTCGPASTEAGAPPRTGG